MPVRVEVYKKSAFFLVLPFTLFSSLLIATQPSFAMSEQTSTTPVGPTIVASGALTERERQSADRQYTYQFRNKALLVNPYLGASAPAGSAGAEPVTQPLTEDEKLYRYFGAATSLYKQGKSEEAIEILKYIIEKDPDNGYVKDYLQKVSYKNKLQENQYKVKAKKSAIFHNKQQTKMSLQNGIDYYKQKKYDLAVAEFSDVLELDPGNFQARQYMQKLKEHYAKEVRIERMTSEQEDAIAGFNGNSVGNKDKGTGTAGVTPAQQALLNKAERAIGANGGLVTDSLLDTAEVKAFAQERNTEVLLDQAELGMTVEDIIAQQREEEAKSDKMTLSIGDSIGIFVYDHPELSARVTIDANNNVMLPLVDEPVNVKGLTTDEASSVITEALKRYVKDPSVMVELLSSSKMFYFIDEVGCTPFPINRPNFTLKDALFLSDWGNSRALGRVIIIKPDKLYPIVKKVDAFDIIYRGNLANNVKIDDGDIVYVPMTIAAKTTQTVNDTLAPLQAIQGARNYWLDAKWTQKGLKSEWRIYPDSQSLPQQVGQNTTGN